MKKNADTFAPQFKKVFNNAQSTNDTVLQEIAQRAADKTIDFPLIRGEVAVYAKFKNSKAQQGEDGITPEGYTRHSKGNSLCK